MSRGRGGAGLVGVWGWAGTAHLSHFIGFGHTLLLRFLFCGLISAFLLVLGAEQS